MSSFFSMLGRGLRGAWWALDITRRTLMNLLLLLIGVIVLFVQIGALWLETQHPCGFPAVATRAR